MSAGVPTVWLGLLNHTADQQGLKLSTVKRSTVIGGSACPPAMIASFGRLRRRRCCTPGA
jgi:hypothetical protein